MKVPFFNKLFQSAARKQKKEELILTRKQMSEKRAKAKRDEKIKFFVKNGERAVALVREKGLTKFSLGKLKIVEKAIVLELANFDKETAIKFGGHWANAHDTLGLVKNRIKELEEKNKWEY